MNQEKIGKFIATLRKEHSMTQKELAQRLGVSDKTVSKWETGRGLPEISIMRCLCDTLEISINELLSGDRLDASSYRQKACAYALKKPYPFKVGLRAVLSVWI